MYLQRRIKKWKLRVFALAFLSIAIPLVIVLKKVAYCTPIRNRLIAMPDGRQLQLIDTTLNAIKLSQAVDVCRYESNGKLNCPTVKFKGETVARQMQLSIGRMLRIVELMSARYNFDYWLWAGALIGSYRQQGFVPWDQDADIGMMESDYEVFLKHALEDLPSDLFMQTKDTDKEQAKVKLFNHGKIRDISTCYGYCPRKGCKFVDGYQVDILAFEETSDGMIEDSYKRFRLSRADFYPVKTAMFEGYEFKVPRNTHKVLLENYGDVSKPPPAERRCTEYIGVPWSSCSEILQMNDTYRNHLLMGTIMSNYPSWATYIL